MNPFPKSFWIGLDWIDNACSSAEDEQGYQDKQVNKGFDEFVRKQPRIYQHIIGCMVTQPPEAWCLINCVGD